MDKFLVEVCCGSADDVIQSYMAGADRVELNSNLFHGGLTPTVGELIVAKKETNNNIPIMTMIRPREAGFCYTDAEFKTAIADAEALIKNGSDGLVFGFLNSDGTIDIERTKILADIAGDKEKVFHRAIDVVPNWKETLDILIDIGITRVLTSGQEPNVFFATDTIKEMIEYANGRIQILPGAGITYKNMNRIIAETGCTQIHVAAYSSHPDTSVHNNNDIFYGGALYPPEDRFNIVDRNYISHIVSLIK